MVDNWGNFLELKEVYCDINMFKMLNRAKMEISLLQSLFFGQLEHNRTLNPIEYYKTWLDTVNKTSLCMATEGTNAVWTKKINKMLFALP